MRSRKPKRFGRQKIKEVCGGAESFNPVGGRKTGLKKERANDIIDSANNAFSFPVLREGVGARHMKMNTTREEEGMGAGVVKLLSVVTLNALNSSTKLRSNIGEK